ncbi:MAG: hypothetical protein HBSAPP03_30100 [Phycisphaerae bacterium]|nr:MAG: hypothetical protein HBSAPP03_30100 [Phycisphaerae bacterium]
MQGLVHVKGGDVPVGKAELGRGDGLKDAGLVQDGFDGVGHGGDRIPRWGGLVLPQAVLEDGSEGGKAVVPGDFLAFFVGAA